MIELGFYHSLHLPGRFMSINGFVFDFDGLILDTESIHFNAWQDEFARFGQILSFEDWCKIIGTDNSKFAPATQLAKVTHGQIDVNIANAEVRKHCDELLEAASPLPGVEDFIKKSFALKIPMAIASSSSKKWVTSHLTKLGLRKYFQTVFCSDDVKIVKPHPELYQKAASALHIPPQHCLAFEDSLNGIKAAKSAGLFCYAIPNKMTKQMDLSLADGIYQSFTELDPLKITQKY